MYLIQLKQVKQALDAGNLAQAADLLKDEYLRSHKDGIILAGQVADALLLRAEAAIKIGNLTGAQADIASALGLVPGHSRATELRDMVGKQASELENARQLERNNIARAGELLADGQLTVSLEMLKGSDNTPAAELLRQQARQYRLERESTATRFKQALEAADIDYCLAITAGMSAGELAASEFSSPLRQFRQMIAERLADDFTAGRLAVFAALLEKAGHIIAGMVEFAHWQDVSRRYRKAAALASGHNYRGAFAQLKPLESVVKDCPWLNVALTKLADMADLQDDINCLLPELQCVVAPVAAFSPKQPARHNEPAAPGNFKAAMTGTNMRIIKIDAVGSYMLFNRDSLSLGPVSASQMSDIAIIAAADSPQLEIHRQDGDYFTSSRNGSVEVNGRTRKEQLLAHGDKIAVSRQGYIKFLRPNPASNTAVLDLKSQRLTRSDIVGAIMAAGEIVLGPGTNAHIRCKSLDSDLILKLDNTGNIWYDGVIINPGELFARHGVSMMIEESNK